MPRTRIRMGWRHQSHSHSHCLSVGGGDLEPESYRIASSNTPTFIQKGNLFPAIRGMETTPVVFNNDLLYVGTRLDSSGLRMTVTRQSDATVLSDQLANMEFVSAIVDNGTLYVFGTTGSRTQISVTSTTDLITWTPRTTVFTAPGRRHVFNTSVTQSPSGFVMAYEFCDPRMVCFNAGFLQSTDLLHWSAIGGVYKVGYYTACPTIRYVNGYYHLFYLSAYPSTNGLTYATNVSRSADLLNWQFSRTTVLSPLDGGDTAMNASDMDLVEFNGKVRILYSNISQIGLTIPNTGLREATYNGTLVQLMTQLF
jgi:alpha-L-fucosidase